MIPRDPIGIVRLVESSEDMMEVLRIVRSLGLPDWWVGAGFVRNRVWDILHGHEKLTPYNDIDVIYFDAAKAGVDDDRAIEKALRARHGGHPWSVTNQARMHLPASDAPYASSRDAIARWPETCTAIAVTLGQNDAIELFAPYGVNDLISLKVVPTPYFHGKREMYEDRMKKKNWNSLWPRLEIFHFR
jgi:uncharacterized protein